jgi:hypothetical protein
MARRMDTGADFRNQKLVNLADGTNPTDGVTKQQLDNAVGGLAWKQPVRAASTTNGTLATAFVTGQTLDGVTLTTGMRILLKDQTTASENGIRVVAVSGAPALASDADSTAELNNATVYVMGGTVNADRAYTQTVNDPTVGTTGLVWAQVGGGTAYTAGTNGGLTLAGSAFSILLDTAPGLVLGAGGIKVDRTQSGSKVGYAADVTSGSTSAAMTHGLGTLDVIVQVYDKASGAQVDCDIVLTSTTVVTLTFGSTITAAQYRVVVLPV